VNDDLRAHLEFFGELGVDGVRLEPEWHSRTERQPAISVPVEADEPEEAVAVASPPAPPTESVEAAKEPVRVFASEAEALDALRVEIGPDCRLCKLHTLGRKQVVFGVGNPNADLMFVGEAPGADEDIQGEPFVGRAGQLLTKIIEAIGMSRSDVYIANVIKCRPPGNRNPEPDEVERCEPFVFR
jgi:DNA polymerase